MDRDEDPAVAVVREVLRGDWRRGAARQGARRHRRDRAARRAEAQLLLRARDGGSARRLGACRAGRRRRRRPGLRLPARPAHTAAGPDRRRRFPRRAVIQLSSSDATKSFTSWRTYTNIDRPAMSDTTPIVGQIQGACPSSANPTTVSGPKRNPTPTSSPQSEALREQLQAEALGHEQVLALDVAIGPVRPRPELERRAVPSMRHATHRTPIVIQLRTLVDGGQKPAEIARLLASFLERAERTLDIAIYDINLRDETEQIVLDTLRAASRRGVRIRLLYNVDRRPPGKVAPPPPKTRADEIEALPFETVGVPGLAGPDAPQVRRARRRLRLDRLDELDGRLVVARGERDRRRRLGGGRGALLRGLRAAPAEAAGSSLGQGVDRARRRHPRRGSRPSAVGGSHTASRTRSAAPSGACGSRRR